jgi:hypothetical protein
MVAVKTNIIVYETIINTIVTQTYPNSIIGINLIPSNRAIIRGRNQKYTTPMVKVNQIICDCIIAGFNHDPGIYPLIITSSYIKINNRATPIPHHSNRASITLSTHHGLAFASVHAHQNKLSV